MEYLESSLFNAYLIEIDEHAAGILKRVGASFAFHALHPAVAGLEGVCFPDVFAAERAARKYFRGLKRRRRLR